MLANQVYARMAYFDSISPKWEGLQTLDLGCAGGYMAEELANRKARVIGIDPWAKVLKIAYEHALGSKLDIAYLAGVGEFLPLADNSIDRAICVDVIEHVQDLPVVLGEIYRVLRPGGMLFFDTVNRNWLSKLVVITIAEKVLHLLPCGTHDYGKFCSPKELGYQLEHIGFKVGPIHGMLPALGLNKYFDLALGRLSASKVMYWGYAVKATS